MIRKIELLNSITRQNKYKHDYIQSMRVESREFNGSVNIPESCDFRSQFDPLNIIC